MKVRIDLAAEDSGYVSIRLPSGGELTIWLLDRDDLEVQVTARRVPLPGEYPESPKNSVAYDHQGNIVRVDDGCPEFFPNRKSK